MNLRSQKDSRFNSARESNAQQAGTGEVYFRNGGSRELRYTCNFDRSGRIYDGRYGREFDPHKHPQDYKAGYRDGERARWRN